MKKYLFFLMASIAFNIIYLSLSQILTIVNRELAVLMGWL